jgi:hypothetical protein
MQMQPIVDRLEAAYGERVGFVRANALDGDVGEAAFRALGLPGHPSVVILAADGAEVFRGFGVLTEDFLRPALEGVSPTPS